MVLADSHLFFLFIPLIVFLHLFFSRINQKLKFFRTGQELLFYLFIFINILYLFTFAFFFHIKNHFSYFFYFFLLINLFYYSYFHFYNMTETARRIKILIMIKTKKVLSPSDFDNNYNVETQIESRLIRLKAMRQLESKNGFYYVKSKLLLHIACAFIYIKKTILGIK